MAEQRVLGEIMLDRAPSWWLICFWALALAGSFAGRLRRMNSKEEIAPLPPLASLIRRTARAGIYRERTRQEPAHISTLEAACCECVSACENLQRLVPLLPLTSPFAKNVHDLIVTVGTIETALHQFVDRELLEEMPGKKREAGGRLQDAVERAHGSLKPTVKASLLAGGIASVLHLFALTLAQLNVQLRAMGLQLEAEPRHGQYTRALACASLGLALIARAAPPSSRLAATPAARRRLALVGGAACARLLLLKAVEVNRSLTLTLTLAPTLTLTPSLTLALTLTLTLTRTRTRTQTLTLSLTQRCAGRPRCTRRSSGCSRRCGCGSCPPPCCSARTSTSRSPTSSSSSSTPHRTRRLPRSRPAAAATASCRFGLGLGFRVGTRV